MERHYIQDKTYDKTDLSINRLVIADYENCNFQHCNMSTTDLSKISFLECTFSHCNLSMSTVNKTAFRDITFKECKLLGLHFETCDDFLFAVEFENCILDLCSFYKMKLKKTKFKNSSLREADFTETDLFGALFDTCDLAKTIFDNTILEKADFRTAYNYSIDPEINRIKKAKFSVPGIAGLLDRYDIEIN